MCPEERIFAPSPDQIRWRDWLHPIKKNCTIFTFKSEKPGLTYLMSIRLPKVPLNYPKISKNPISHVMSHRGATNFADAVSCIHTHWYIPIGSY